MYGKSFHPWVIALTVASAILSGCAGRAGRTLDDVESYVQESPDSAFTVLEAMDTSAFFRPRDAARYSLLHTMAADKTTMDTNDVSLIAPAVRYYTRKGPLKYRMMTKFYEGRLNRYAGNCQEAIVSGTKAKQLADRIGDLYWRAMTCSELGYTYGKALLTREELSYLSEAKDLWFEYGDETHKRNAIANLAMAYCTEAEFERADSLYACLIRDFPSKPHYLVKRAQNAMLGVLYPPEEIVDMYRTAMDKGVEMSVEYYYEYACALAHNGNHRDARSILDQLEQYPKDLNASYCLFHIAEAGCDYQQAFFWLKTYMHKSDSVVNQVLDQSVYKSLATQSKLESKIAEERAKRISVITWTVAVALCLGAFGVYRKRRRILEEENDRLVRLCDESNRLLESLRHQGASDLNEVKGRLKTTEEKLSRLRNSFARMYQSQLKSIGQLLDYDYSDAKQRLESYKAQYAERVEGILNSLRKDFRNQQEFENIINSELEGIMTKLRADFQDFKEDDFRLLSYVIVGFDYTTCSSLMDWSGSRVRVYKMRLAQQIEASGSENRDLYMSFLAPRKQSRRD